MQEIHPRLLDVNGMAHYQVTLSYDGTEFKGYQRQGIKRTVQRCVEEALRKLGWTATSIVSAGRTDTGVHASGQVFTFDLVWNHPMGEILCALNTYLPADISARKIQEAAPDFHPRFDAKSREYRYRVLCETIRDPLLERYAWRLNKPVDYSVLTSSAAVIMGEHDFTAYGTPPRAGSGTIRNVTRSEWQIEGSELKYTICANAFLYHMVRRLVFVQVEAASGRIDPQRLRDHFEAGFQDHPGIAPACGLELIRVNY
jgi:tRNA pseudouridine38-40 synthase